MSYGEERDRQSDLAVMGANEFKNKQRLKEILEAREEVFGARKQAEKAYIQGEISADGRNLVILRSVRRFIEEVWNLLLEHAKGLDDVSESEYLNKRELGRIQFERREDIVIQGLADFLHCKEQFHETWTEEVAWRHGDDQDVRRSRTQTIPPDVSKQAFLTTCEFLNEEDDLDIQFEELDDTIPEHGHNTVNDDADQRVEKPEDLADFDGDFDLRAIQNNGHEPTENGE